MTVAVARSVVRAMAWAVAVAVLKSVARAVARVVAWAVAVAWP